MAFHSIFIKNWLKLKKYGFAYLLSNGSSGFIFNDQTRIILDSELE